MDHSTNIIAMFLAIAAAIAVWWLVLQRLMARPWLEQGSDIAQSGEQSPYPAAAIGLGMFLAVVTSLFGLFSSAYMMRMSHGDWRPLAEPALLWFNTGALLLSSAALQWVWFSLARPDTHARRIRRGLLVAGVFALVFLFGQLAAWQRLDAAGYRIALNPAYTFFYMLTALHGLHLLGGLWVGARTTLKAWRMDLARAEAGDIIFSIKLCTVYWHYLLLLWLALFGLLLAT